MNSKSKTKSKIKLAYIVLSLIILLPLVMLLAGCGEDPEMRIVVNFEEAETKANNDYYIVLEEKTQVMRITEKFGGNTPMKES